MLQGYFDASGTKEHAVISLAGFVTNSGKWAEFSEDWQAALDRHHLTVFKMQIESKRKPIEKRNARITDFAAIIKKHILFKIESSISVPDFTFAVSNPISGAEQLVCEKSYLLIFLRRLLDDPCFWIISQLVVNFGLGVWERSYHHPFDLFFDEQILEMCHAAPIFYEIAKTFSPPKYRRIFPDHLISRPDNEFRPLQAADMFAWLARKKHGQDIDEWEWLVAELETIESMRCPFVGKQELTSRMWGMIKAMCAPRTEFPEEKIARWSKLIAAG
jgi:hypothetical protein